MPPTAVFTLSFPERRLGLVLVEGEFDGIYVSSTTPEDDCEKAALLRPGDALLGINGEGLAEDATCESLLPLLEGRPVRLTFKAGRKRDPLYVPDRRGALYVEGRARVSKAERTARLAAFAALEAKQGRLAAEEAGVGSEASWFAARATAAAARAEGALVVLRTLGLKRRAGAANDAYVAQLERVASHAVEARAHATAAEAAVAQGQLLDRRPPDVLALVAAEARVAAARAGSQREALKAARDAWEAVQVIELHARADPALAAVAASATRDAREATRLSSDDRAKQRSCMGLCAEAGESAPNLCRADGVEPGVVVRVATARPRFGWQGCAPDQVGVVVGLRAGHEYTHAIVAFPGLGDHAWHGDAADVEPVGDDAGCSTVQVQAIFQAAETYAADEKRRGDNAPGEWCSVS